MLNRLFALVVAAALLAPAVSAQARRALTLDDHPRIVNVGDPQRSPDGLWVAYTVTTIDAEKDRRNTDVWMEVGWQRTAAADLVARQRELTALESRQQSPWHSCRRAGRKKSANGRADLVAQSRRRRSAARQRLQGRRVRHPVVARQHAHRVRCPGSGSRRGAGEARGAGSGRPRCRS